MSKTAGYAAFACAVLAVFSVYLHTMHPAFKNNDSPETSATAVTLGIGHPPAYPLYTMAGKIFTLVPAGNYAFRMNIFSSFLAIMALIVTFFIIKKHILRLAGAETGSVRRILAPGAVLVLAFSSIFWNQGIEAKGGIYMLNLLFLSLIIYLSLEQLRVPGIESRVKDKPQVLGKTALPLGTRDSGPETKNTNRNLFLISFLFGLSLANHWPSMIILAPVFAYLFIKYRKLLKVKGLILCAGLIAIGVTPYIYLPIRANAGALFNWGDPKDLQGFLWVALRQGYTGPVEASLHVFKYQVLEFLKVFALNYSLFFILAFAGAYALYKKAKREFLYLLSAFLIISVMVVFYNRTREGVIYLLDIFLMPAGYISLLFIAAGAAFIVGLLESRKALLYASSAAMLAVFSFMAVKHYKANNSGRDFLSYDFGRAILNTMEPGSVYMADGDYNLMPVYYLQDIMNYRRDIITATDSFLIFKWGIDDFVKKHGNVPMKPFDTANNEVNIIGAFMDRAAVYKSNYFPRFDSPLLAYAVSQKGIIQKLSKSSEVFGPWIYDTYSYRGLYDGFCVQNRANIDLVGWYAVSMVNQANALNLAGRLNSALKLYKRALLFPNEKPEANILFSIALVYEKMRDYENELLYLNRAVLLDPKMTAAFEKAGIIYYEKAFYSRAKDMFTRAKALGSNNELAAKGLNILNSMNETQIMEAMLLKANEHVEKQDIKKASELYDFLLEKRYKSDIIHRNIGVYHFRTNNYDAAIEEFVKSNNETPSQDAYLYTAYAYYRQNKLSKAMDELEAGLKVFKGDKRLNELYMQLKAQEKSSEKNSDSGNGQR